MAAVSPSRRLAWRSAERAFLREVFVGACRYFTTVLGPGSDAFHYDPFHLDLACHGRNGDIHVCRPEIEFKPRIDPDAAPIMSVWPRKGGDPTGAEPVRRGFAAEAGYVTRARRQDRSRAGSASRPVSDRAGGRAAKPGRASGRSMEPTRHRA